MLQFLVGVGAGGATLVREISAWTLGSIGGFSNASSKLLARALRSQPAARSPPMLTCMTKNSSQKPKASSETRCRA